LRIINGTPSQSESVPEPAVGHRGGRRPSEKDHRRPRGEWNQRPPGVRRRGGKADCPGSHRGKR